MFTRYWNGPINFTAEYLQGVSDIIDAFEHETGHIIRNAAGVGSALISHNRVSLNGDAAKEEEYESFDLEPMTDGSSCKTDRKPYDLLVAAILVYTGLMNPGFTHKSDGGEEENLEAEMFLHRNQFVYFNRPFYAN